MNPLLDDSLSSFEKSVEVQREEELRVLRYATPDFVWTLMAGHPSREPGYRTPQTETALWVPLKELVMTQVEVDWVLIDLLRGK